MKPSWAAIIHTALFQGWCSSLPHSSSGDQAKLGSKVQRETSPPPTPSVRKHCIKISEYHPLPCFFYACTLSKSLNPAKQFSFHLYSEGSHPWHNRMTNPCLAYQIQTTQHWLQGLSPIFLLPLAIPSFPFLNAKRRCLPHSYVFPVSIRTLPRDVLLIALHSATE